VWQDAHPINFESGSAMNWVLTLNVVILFAAAVVAIPLMFHAWRRRETPGATPLALMALSVVVWTTCAGVYLFLSSPEAKEICVALEFVGIVLLPPAWLAFSLRFTVRHFRFRKRFLVPIAAVSFAMVALVATNGRTNLVWTAQSEPAAIYRIFVIYGFTLSIVAVALLLEKAITSASTYRRQSIVMVVAGLIPMLTSLLNELGCFPAKMIDPTPLGFLFSVLLIWWGLFRLGILDIIPIAQRLLLDCMTDGMLVVDARHRILDMNRAAQTMLEGASSEFIGHAAGEVLPIWDQLREVCHPKGPSRKELPIHIGLKPRLLELNASPIINHLDRPVGYLLLLHDITERRQAEVDREKLIVELRTALLEVKTLTGILPICAGCKKIRDKQDQWHPLDAYIVTHTDAKLSHGLCPDCIQRLYPEYS
jgi:PAS domain-containing protein